MSHRHAHVRDAVLVYGDADGREQMLTVGSPAWYAWLNEEAECSFTFEANGQAFSASKERKQRGGWYWVAYHRVGSKRFKAYLGKPEDVSGERLHTVAATLLARRFTAESPALPHARPNTRMQQSNALLATKLYTPRARANIVPRPRLISRVQTAIESKLTLACAPAGFGKTTLLSAWIAAQQAETPACNIGWVSLDAADNDPARFWRYVITALDRCEPGVGDMALAALQASRSFPSMVVLTNLLNALSDVPSDIVLILDDYHVITTPTIHQSLIFLLDHLPPRVHLVIAARSDPPLPLARLRARGELNELRVTDLRFTREEAATFLLKMRKLPLSDEAVAALETRTEGWIAGLQLAALALYDHADPVGFVAAFTGSNRFVMDYLASEVLDGMPAHVHAFVLQTSILTTMSGSLCDALLNNSAPWADGAQAVLEDLERANLFVVPLDDERQWYRYHHLFAEVARARLHATLGHAAVATLHQRASTWYEQQGMIVEAVQHALAAQDWEHVARIVEQHGLAIAIGGLVRTVLDWLELIPDEHVRTRPLLCICHAIVLMFTNQLEASEARLRAAERCVTPDTPSELAHAVLGQVALARANLVRASGDLAASVALSQQALELLPETTTIARAGVILNNARAFQLTGDVSPAVEQQVRAAIAPTRAVGNLIATLNGFTNLARLYVLQGRLRAAAATYDEAEQIAPGELRVFSNSPAYHFGVADLLRQWHDLEAAERYLAQGMELMRGGLIVEADVVTAGYLTLARTQQARQDSAGALATLGEFVQLARQRGFFPHLLAEAAALRAGLLLVQGQLDAALQWADASGLLTDDDLSYLHEYEHLTLARIHIAQGTCVDDALHLLERLLTEAEQGARMGSVIEIRILQALAFQARGDRAAALRMLDHALTLAAPEGYVQVFVDEGTPMAELLAQRVARKAPNDPLVPYLTKLLAAFPPEQRGAEQTTYLIEPVQGSALARSDALIEPLTQREREVLRLIAEGASNREIAERLVITVGTVKRHVNNLFGKLGVQSRTQALSVTRTLDLL